MGYVKYDKYRTHIPSHWHIIPLWVSLSRSCKIWLWTMPLILQSNQVPINFIKFNYTLDGLADTNALCVDAFKTNNNLFLIFSIITEFNWNTWNNLKAIPIRQLVHKNCFCDVIQVRESYLTPNQVVICLMLPIACTTQVLCCNCQQNISNMIFHIIQACENKDHK